MKKVLSITLAMLMLFGVLSVGAYAEGEAAYEVPAAVQASITKIKNVDANENGTYETGDVTRVLEAAAGIVPADDYSKYDINGDGYVTVKDAKSTLNIITGVESVVTDEELLTVFNERVNSVKTVLPGFTKREVLDCSSILVTTKNAPVADLNVTNLEYNQYVNKLVKLMNSFPYNLALDDAMRAELTRMQKAAEDAYEPQSRSGVIHMDNANEHYNNYPIGNMMKSSFLTMADIKSIGYSMVNGEIIINVGMDNYSYNASTYPILLTDKVKTPYGKVFNFPAIDSNDGSTVNSLALKNGKIELRVNYETYDCVRAVYSYNYTADIKAAKDPESDLEMTTKTTADLQERYIFNRVTVS